MSPLATTALSVGTLVVGWLLNELSHIWHSREQDRRDLAQTHRAVQTEALIKLQQIAIAYHGKAQRFLLVAYAHQEYPDDAQSAREYSTLSGEIESFTSELFAARAHVDDLRIRSFVDYLDEMVQQFTSSPAEINDEHGTTTNEDNLFRQGDDLQGILWRLNDYIGSRLLELVGVVDPEVPPYRGE